MLKRYTPIKRSAAPLKRTPIRRVSKKRAKQMREYGPAAKAFLAKHPICQVWLKENGWSEVQSPVETKFAHPARAHVHAAASLIEDFGALPSEEVHHANKRHGTRLLVEKDWRAVSRVNHVRIENNLAWARENGFSLNI